MGRVNETIHNVNTTLRSLLMLVLVGGAGFGGYKAYEVYNEPQQLLAEKQAELSTVRASLARANDDLFARQQEIVTLNAELDEQAKQIERLEVSMKLLKVQHRVARLTVLDQRERAGAEMATTGETPEEDTIAAENADQSTSNLITRLEFIEINEEGNPIGEAKQFEIVGDMVYIDYLRVTFDDKYIEESDLDRSTAIALFQRIFGEHQEAVDGFRLDTVGSRPTAYGRGTEMSDFERKIWGDFWLIANDTERAAAMGIHAAHGNAVSIRVQRGKVYEIKLRTTGDMTIRPVDEPQAAETGP
jgi:hypothetical protein